MRITEQLKLKAALTAHRISTALLSDSNGMAESMHKQVGDDDYHSTVSPVNCVCRVCCVVYELRSISRFEKALRCHNQRTKRDQAKQRTPHLHRSILFCCLRVSFTVFGSCRARSLACSLARCYCALFSDSSLAVDTTRRILSSR